MLTSSTLRLLAAPVGGATGSTNPVVIGLIVAFIVVVALMIYLRRKR